MKKILTICFLLSMAFTSQAQNGKPTKEETLQYLKSTILDVWGGQYKNFTKGRAEDISAIEDVKMDGCILRVKYKGQLMEDDRRKPVEISEEYGAVIDFSMVEAFKFKIETPYNDWKIVNENLLLYYDTKERKQVYCMGFYCKPEDTEKVLKALNHLRKLCGAPEPISFD